MKKVIAALLLVAVVTLSSCSETPNAKNTYQSGDGAVTEFKQPDRPAVVTWSGTTSDNEKISSANLTGVVTVMNFWYASCPPCRREMPDLVSLSEEFNGKAQFIGVNVRDSADTANAFKKSFKVNYPTLMDANDGAVVLAFTGVVTPSAVPTTLVIDREGRVAARVLGLADKSILRTLIQTVIDEVPSN